MSDNQRRLICRFIFLITCALPTSTIVYWLCHPQTPLQWQTKIQSQLGVLTSVDSIETPGPYVTILRGLEFTDADLGSLLEATEVHIVLGKPNRIKIPHSVRTTNAGLLQLIDTINEHLIRAHSTDQPWQILFLGQTIIEQSMVSQQPGSEFPSVLIAENLQVDVGPLLAGGTGALLQFRLPQIDEEKWVECRLSRSLAGDNQNSEQRLYLNTKEMPLPCWLLGDLIPEIQQLGPECQFAGVVDVYSHTDRRCGEFRGVFTHIEIPGMAETKAQVEVCRFDGGIDKLDAFLVLPDGSMSRIQETIEVVKRFDVLGAIRTAANADHYSLQAETKLR